MPLNVALVPGAGPGRRPADRRRRPLHAARWSPTPSAQAARLGTRQVVVDVAAVRFWDCSGLHALVDVHRRLAAAGRSCRIVGALAATRRLIGLAYLADRLVLDGPVPTRPRAGPPPAAAACPPAGR